MVAIISMVAFLVLSLSSLAYGLINGDSLFLIFSGLFFVCVALIKSMGRVSIFKRY